MPAKAEVLPDFNLFVMRVSGRPDSVDILEYQALIPEVPGYQPTLNNLIDAREVEVGMVTPAALIRIGSSTPFDPGTKRAYVVSSKKASMLATVFGALASYKNNFLVTYKLEDACQWLGLSIDDLEESSIYKETINA